MWSWPVSSAETFRPAFSEQSRQLYLARLQRGEAAGFWLNALGRPLKTIAAVLAIVLVLGLSLLPFIRGL